MGKAHWKPSPLTGGLLVFLLIAWTLRVTTLTLQSMWIDEVMALYFTRGTFAETLRTIIRPQDNGPLFYLLLFWWRHLMGDSDFAVRYLSALFSALTLPLVYRLARALLNRRAAALAMWLTAFSPFMLWFAQEAKMYALHMMVAVASTLMLLDAFRKGRVWRWAAYGLLVSSVLYSHLFGGFLVVAHGAMSVILGWRRPKRWWAYCATMLAVGLAHLPLVRVAWNIIRFYQPRDTWRYFVPLKDMARDLLAQYIYRLSYLEVSGWLLLLPAALLMAGIVALGRRKDAWILPIQALLPVLVFYPISHRAPVYSAKYLSAIAPAVMILIAWGAERLARLWRPLGLTAAALGLLMLGGVRRDLTEPVFQRGDWRFIARYIEQHEGPNDIVVISAFYTSHAFQRYYRGVSAVLPFEADPYKPEPLYQELSERYDRMWLILHHDEAMAPKNRLREGADAMFPRITEQYPNGGQITLIGYLLRPFRSALPATAHPLEACFQNGLCLVGYQVDATILPPTEHLSHPPSNWLHVTLYWRREAAFDGVPIRPLVRLIDGAFNVWGGNMERYPDLLHHSPPDRWPSDSLVEAHYDLNLNPITPAGEYRLELSLAIAGDENRRVPLRQPFPGQPPDRLVFENIRIVSGR